MPQESDRKRRGLRVIEAVCLRPDGYYAVEVPERQICAHIKRVIRDIDQSFMFSDSPLLTICYPILNREGRELTHIWETVGMIVEGLNYRLRRGQGEEAVQNMKDASDAIYALEEFVKELPLVESGRCHKRLFEQFKRQLC